MSRVKGVLLDIDGTLLDSNDAHARSWVEVFEEFDFRIPFEKVRPLIGMGGDKLLPELTGVQEDSELGKRLTKRRQRLFLEKHLPELRPFAKARELVQALSERGLKCVVATSAGPEELSALLRQAEVLDLIDAKTSSGDADESKPAPDIVEAAIRRSGHAASELVMLGDTAYDVAAATAAGVPIVALRSGGWTDVGLTGAIAIYDDAADLLAQLEDSPFAA